jgi:hypothetical protein
MVCSGALHPLNWSKSFLLALSLCGVAGGSAAAAADESWRDDWETADGLALEIDAEGFDFPSAIAVVPNPGTGPKDPLYFVTELRGKVKVVTNDRTIYTFAENFFRLEPPAELPSIEGEMGMAGITLDPERGYVFVSFIYQDSAGILRNNIVRFQSTPQVFSVQPAGQVSFDHIFSGFISRVAHQIGPMVIDSDTMYVSVGDAGRPFESQDPDSLLGKILRITLDGEPVPGNPFYEPGSAHRPRDYVWATGLRNPFGLARANEKLFAAENGIRIDRFLEIERGGNYQWDGTDWSLGTNALMVFGPAVAPVQLAWLPGGVLAFPEQYYRKFYLALAGGQRAGPGRHGEKSVVQLDYDFASGAMRHRPKQILRYRGQGYQTPVGVAVGSDGMYIASLYPVRSDRGAILKLRYDPDNAHPNVIGRDLAGRALMIEHGCFGCHGERPVDVNFGPPLDPQTLVPRLVAKLESRQYAEEVAQVDALTSEPFNSFRDARAQIMAADGVERVRLWMKHFLLEPNFDRRVSAMPNLGLAEEEAVQIADYLINRSDAGAHQRGAIFARLASVARKLFSGLNYRHMPIILAFGFLLGVAFVGLAWLLLSKLRKRRPRLQQIS